MKVEDEVQLTHVAKVAVQHLHKLVDRLQCKQLIVLWVGGWVCGEGGGGVGMDVRWIGSRASSSCGDPGTPPNPAPWPASVPHTKMSKAQRLPHTPLTPPSPPLTPPPTHPPSAPPPHTPTCINAAHKEERGVPLVHHLDVPPVDKVAEARGAGQHQRRHLWPRGGRGVRRGGAHMRGGREGAGRDVCIWVLHTRPRACAPP